MSSQAELEADHSVAHQQNEHSDQNPGCLHKKRFVL
jgi:hypothetical protein